MTTETEMSETETQVSCGRSDFLLHMYDQMWGNINRHILVVWQSVGVLLAIPATLALLSTGTISIDVAVSLIVVVCAWLLAHVEDASYWFNRNLAIIANIERQFLRPADLQEIHYYFGNHRDSRETIEHLAIQRLLGMTVWVSALLYHALQAFSLAWTLPTTWHQFLCYLPWAATAGCAIYIVRLRRHFVEQYARFQRLSPGKAVEEMASSEPRP